MKQLLNLIIVITLLLPIFAFGQQCDIDSDGDVDRLDITSIVNMRNQSAVFTNDPMDADNNGTITIRDARACTRLCTERRCAVVENNNPKASLLVLLTDTHGQPLSGVMAVNTQSQTAVLSDDSGVIVITDIPAQETITLKFSHHGFADNSKQFTSGPVNSKLNKRVVLIAQEPTIRHAIEANNQIVGKDGASVRFSENAFVDENGNLVSGIIDIKITPVDVTASELSNAFPGQSLGYIAQLDNEFPLLSYGTTQYSFSQQGRPLQLAPNQTASIEMPLYVDRFDNGELVQLGDIIPVWSLNEETAIWEYEGKGTVVASALSVTGLALQAEVTHFSWWNIDDFAGGGGGGFDGTRSNRRVNVSVKLNVARSYPGYSTFGEVVLLAPQPMFTKTITVQLNQFSTIRIPEGTTCFIGGAFVTVGNVDKLVGYSDNRCFTFSADDTTNRQVELTINQSDEFNGVISAPICSIVDEPFGPAVVTALSGSNPFVYAAGVPIPSGITINSDTGVISGIPDTVGPFDLSATVTEDEGTVHFLSLSGLRIAAKLSIEVDVESDIPFNEFYQSPPANTQGGCGMNRYKTVGDLPPGMVINAITGSISGIPTQAVNSEFVIEVFDKLGNRARTPTLSLIFAAPQLQANGALSVAPGESLSLLPADLVTNTGGHIDSFEVSDLPSWLSYEVQTGMITGIAPIQADTAFTVTAINLSGTSSAVIQLRVIDVLLPPTNLIATVLGDVVYLTWTAESGILSHLITVLDVNGNVLAEYEVNGESYWLTDLPFEQAVRFEVASRFGEDRSDNSAPTGSVSTALPPTVQLLRTPGDFYTNPNQLAFSEEKQALLVFAGSLFEIPLEAPQNYQMIVGSGTPNLGSVSGGFYDSGRGYVLNHKIPGESLPHISLLPQATGAPELITQWPLLGVRGIRHAAIVKGNNNNMLTKSNTTQTSLRFSWQLAKIDQDGVATELVYFDDIDWAAIGNGVSIYNYTNPDQEHSAFDNGDKIAMVTQGLRELIGGAALVIADANRAAAISPPSLFPLENCFEDVSDSGQYLLNTYISDISEGSQTQELLLYADTLNSANDGILKINMLSQTCQMIIGTSINRGIIGDAEIFDTLEQNQVEIVTVGNQQSIVMVKNTQTPYPLVNYDVYLLEESSGSVSRLLTIQLTFEGFD